MKIYNRLSVLRAEASLSRQELADAVGINVQTVGFIERGDYHPSLELAFTIAQVFEVDVSTVFSTRPFQSIFKKRSD